MSENGPGVQALLFVIGVQVEEIDDYIWDSISVPFTAMLPIYCTVNKTHITSN